MKKAIAGLTALVLLLVLVSCAGKESSGPEEMPAFTPETPEETASPDPGDWSGLPSQVWAEALRDGVYYYTCRMYVGGQLVSGWAAGDGQRQAVSLALPAGETLELVRDGYDYRIDLRGGWYVRTSLEGLTLEGEMTWQNSGEGTVAHPDWEEPQVCFFDTYILGGSGGGALQSLYVTPEGELAAILTVVNGESSWAYVDSFEEKAPRGAFDFPEGFEDYLDLTGESAS